LRPRLQHPVVEDVKTAKANRISVFLFIILSTISFGGSNPRSGRRGRVGLSIRGKGNGCDYSAPKGWPSTIVRLNPSTQDGGGVKLYNTIDDVQTQLVKIFHNIFPTRT